MTAVIDYDTGNLKSVENILKRVGVEYSVTADPAVIASADHVLSPGVGEASTAMEKLRSTGLDKLIPTLKQPVLGICIGMQLMCLSSEEGNTQCMGIFDAHVRKFRPGAGIKVPHMGWNKISDISGPLFDGLPEGAFVYYVHSFAPDIAPGQTIATTCHGVEFSGALNNRNFYGTQFHPEKSGEVGEQIIRNFHKLK